MNEISTNLLFLLILVKLLPTSVNLNVNIIFVRCTSFYTLAQLNGIEILGYVHEFYEIENIWLRIYLLATKEIQK